MVRRVIKYFVTFHTSRLNKNYNYEAKRTRDASERFNSSAEPYQRKSDMETLDHKNWRMAKERWEMLSKKLAETTKKLRDELLDLQKDEWFNEGIDDSSNK